MAMAAKAIIILVLLASSAHAERIVINDPGGVVLQHNLLGKQYAIRGTELAVKYCASACLDLIGQVPRSHVCFYPDAWICTHTAAMRRNELGICCVESPTTMHWERGRDWIVRGYNSCGA